MKDKPSVSLIIPTYNNPSFLRLSVLSANIQTILPNEIIIADDGSSEETFREVARLKKETNVPIMHIWQEDKGFQLAKIRNVAVVAANYEYIVQIDGDIIMERHFIEDHLYFSSKGKLLQGSRVLIDKRKTQKLVSCDKIDLSILSIGISRRENAFRCLSLSEYLSTRYRNRYPVYYARGANMSYFKSDFMLVNGYDEDFIGWGHEDSDLTLRMLNRGIQKLYIKFSCVAYHLYHQEASRDLEQSNKKLLEEHYANKVITCDNGANKYIGHTKDYIKY